MQPVENTISPARFPLLNLGFRPFFSGAGIFAVVSILAWAGMTELGWQPDIGGLSLTAWHAHEMIYGYAMAVIAGFLLTATGNWTGIRMISGIPLLLLFLLWLGARLLLFTGGMISIQVAALLDITFLVWLICALLIPVIKVKQWKQMGIISKLLLLLVSNGIFYAGALGMMEDGMRIGLYSGLYMIIALIFVMTRRVLPFFIEKGVGYPVQLKNRRWLDATSLVLFLAFWIADILRPDTLAVALLSLALLGLHGVRLADWYTPGIWKKPLLWILYLGYGWLIAGFALKAAVFIAGIPPFLPLHAFAYGGIGMITMGMMSRVTLGHTGRNILDPPPTLPWIFTALLLGTIFRILLPLFDPARYLTWIGISQVLWIAAFLVFLYSFLPMLGRVRLDGQPG